MQLSSFATMTPRPAFGERTAHKRQSAAASSRAAMPLILALVPEVTSVVEVGSLSGAAGEWLAAAMALGIADVRGLDGPWADRDDIAVEPSLITIADIDQEMVCDRTFDLALCIEFVEHLPPQRAASFIKELCALAPVVAFSAAIPDQGGHGHLNEQWPTYWEILFADANYRMLDPLRMQLWAEPHGPAYIAQNLFIAVDQSRVAQYPALAQLAAANPGPVLSLVHPETFEKVLYLTRHLSIRQAASALGGALRLRVQRETKRWRGR